MMKIKQCSIELSGIRFFAYHGVMPHEKKVGNEFQIDLNVFFPGLQAMESGDLDRTINYAKLYELLKEEMDIPTPLLEEVCYKILKRLHCEFPMIERAKITLRKMMPPIPGFQGDSVAFTAEANYLEA